MAGIETNIFPITNLASLSSRYRLYRVKGLTPDQTEYYQNRQHLKRKLSYLLRKPVTVIDREGVPHVVVREDAGELPSPLELVRTFVRFESLPGAFDLDYSERSSENDEICLRFLQFMLQEPLHSHPDLWQPKAGQAFFKKEPAYATPSMLHFRGFAVRAVVTPDGGLGLCVHVTNKYLSRHPLPTHISRDQFPKWKNKHYIYRYGHRWYEIRVSGLADLSVTEYVIKKDEKLFTLLDYIVSESKKPIPQELAEIPHDAAVVLYRDNQGQERAAPAPLCYLVYGAHDEETERYHERSILPPWQRQKLASDFVRRYLTRLRFGDLQLCVAKDPLRIPPQMFTVPDLKFGNSRVLSVRGTPGAQHVSLDGLGSARLALLKDKSAGFYKRGPLDRQYFIMPQSVYESYGKRFMEDLAHAVHDLYPRDDGDGKRLSYEPVIETYNDRVPRTFPYQGNAIMESVKVKCKKPGYAVVMIHHTTDRRIREEDQLAAMVVRELRKLDIYGAVMHSSAGYECYRLINDRAGKASYVPKPESRGKLSGYLRMVALNKVLLTNQRWPFVLETPLNADLTVGVDVKHNTAGLVVVGKNGGDIRAIFKTSRQKEQLLEEQFQSYLVEIIREEARARTEPVRSIVIHRDGRVWPSEVRGAQKALTFLKREGIIGQDASVTILEIAKSSPAPVRFFDSVEREGRTWTYNPQVGLHYIANGTDGHLCSTGRAFSRPGTVNPLHVRHVEGPLPMEKCLEDVFSLTTLTWTRPEDCTRYPITIKLNDRFLGGEASEYDAEALEYAASLREDAATYGMSEAGLYSGLYDQIREYAELLDTVLIGLKGGTSYPDDESRRKLSNFLTSLGSRRWTDLSTRLVAILLRDKSDVDEREWVRAGNALLSPEVDGSVIELLENLALSLEQEQVGAMARLRGSSR
jgi:hypothetical protein